VSSVVVVVVVHRMCYVVDHIQCLMEQRIVVQFVDHSWLQVSSVVVVVVVHRMCYVIDHSWPQVSLVMVREHRMYYVLDHIQYPRGQQIVVQFVDHNHHCWSVIGLVWRFDLGYMSFEQAGM
jgi:hypothetical protein